jgi:ATP-dependent protease ClpP protease subunit
MGDIKLINLKDRLINLFCDVTEDSCKEVIEKIQDINIKDDEYISSSLQILASMGFSTDPSNISLPPITLNLSTFGGDVYSGFGLCDSIRMSETSVKIICYGKVMSMGIPILLSGHYRAAHKNTTFMLHDVSSCTWGKTREMEECIEQNKILREKMIEYICSRTKFPRKKLTDIIDKKQDFYFSAEDALKWKFIDEIIDINMDDVEPKKTSKKKQNKNVEIEDGKE